jgi:diaminopimelate epimerase
MNIPAKYMSGAGNVFTVIDGRHYSYTVEDWQKITPKLCGSDFRTEGLIVLTQSTISEELTHPLLNFDAEFFNPDGSYGAMCGNGGRCAVRFALHTIDSETAQNISEIHFTMAGATYQAEQVGNDIRVYFPMPLEYRKNITVNYLNTTISGDYADVGSQHFVINYEQLHSDVLFQEFDISTFAPPLRFHKDFAPLGVNINIFAVENDKLHLRTYERGVEAETGACGTGAISTAISMINHAIAHSPITLIPTSNIPLTVGYEPENSVMWLQGAAEFIGEIFFTV